MAYLLTMNTFKPGPRLEALLASGIVWKDHSEFVGKASDGTEVQIGNDADNPARIESYLASNPGPENW
jgi:hypothetical protein